MSLKPIRRTRAGRISKAEAHHHLSQAMYRREMTPADCNHFTQTLWVGFRTGIFFAQKGRLTRSDIQHLRYLTQQAQKAEARPQKHHDQCHQFGCAFTDFPHAQ